MRNCICKLSVCQLQTAQNNIQSCRSSPRGLVSVRSFLTRSLQSNRVNENGIETVKLFFNMMFFIRTQHFLPSCFCFYKLYHVIIKKLCLDSIEFFNSLPPKKCPYETCVAFRNSEALFKRHVFVKAYRPDKYFTTSGPLFVSAIYDHLPVRTILHN